MAEKEAFQESAGGDRIRPAGRILFHASDCFSSCPCTKAFRCQGGWGFRSFRCREADLASVFSVQIWSDRTRRDAAFTCLGATLHGCAPERAEQHIVPTLCKGTLRWRMGEFAENGGMDRLSVARTQLLEDLDSAVQITAFNVELTIGILLGSFAGAFASVPLESGQFEQ